MNSFLLVIVILTVALAAARPPIDQRCGENEMWAECSGCEPTCEEQFKPCPLMCRPPQCQCQMGFLRDVEGKCVSPTECPAIGSSTTTERSSTEASTPSTIAEEAEDFIYTSTMSESD